MKVVFSSCILMKKALSYEKRAIKMVMKLTPGVNFINVSGAAFVPVDPKSIKRYWQIDWILLLLGATGVKVIRNMLVKLSPRVKKACFKYSLIRQCESISFLDFRLLRVSTESDFHIWIWTGKFSVVFFLFCKTDTKIIAKINVQKF